MPDMDARRLVYLQLLDDVLRNGCKVYYPDLPFIDAVESTLITNAIWLAERKRKPCTVASLAKLLGMSRGRVERRLAELEAMKYVRRNGRLRAKRLRFNPEILARPQAEGNLHRGCDLIAQAYRKLFKTDDGRS